MLAIIKGSAVMPYVEAIWGCEFIEDVDENQQKIISEIGYTIDNTTKTRALFEINKGVPQRPDIDVNAKMSDAYRRVAFPNMIYIADGPVMYRPFQSSINSAARPLPSILKAMIRPSNKSISCGKTDASTCMLKPITVKERRPICG